MEIQWAFREEFYVVMIENKVKSWFILFYFTKQ